MNKHKSQKEFTYQDQYEQSQKLLDFKDLLHRIKNQDVEFSENEQQNERFSATMKESLNYGNDLNVDRLKLSDQQKKILKSLDQVAQNQLVDQYKTYKQMIISQPIRVQELFTDKITELRRKNQVAKQKEGVKLQVYKYKKNLITVPQGKRPDQVEQLESLINLCHNFNQPEKIEQIQSNEGKVNQDVQTTTPQNMLLPNKHTKKNSSVQSQSQDSYILLPINSINKLATRNAAQISRNVGQGTAKPAFRIKKLSTDLSQIVLQKFQNQHIKDKTQKDNSSNGPYMNEIIQTVQGQEDTQTDAKDSKKDEYQCSTPISPNMYKTMENPLMSRWALKQAKYLQVKDQSQFQQKFINHKNSVVKIINNTFKKIKTTKADQELKNKVNVLKEEFKTKKDLIKLQNKFRNEYKLATQFNMPSYIEEFSTRVVTPMFTLPRNILDLQRMNQRSVFSANADLRESGRSHLKANSQVLSEVGSPNYDIRSQFAMTHTSNYYERNINTANATQYKAQGNQSSNTKIKVLLSKQSTSKGGVKLKKSRGVQPSSDRFSRPGSNEALVSPWDYTSRREMNELGQSPSISNFKQLKVELPSLSQANH